MATEAPDLTALRRDAEAELAKSPNDNQRAVQDAHSILALVARVEELTRTIMQHGVKHRALMDDAGNSKLRAERAEEALATARQKGYQSGYNDGSEKPGDRQ